jgi:mannitol/fructose-specific phosphotransferase system IIA component (Ntr-type)
MRFSDHLDTKFVNLALTSTTRDEAIGELAEILRSHPCVVDFEKYLADVFARERQASTGVGLGAAIPHARTDAVSDLVVAVGRTSGSIDFQSIDGKPVQVVLLLGTPQAKVKTYLRLLAHLSHLFKTNGFLPALLRAGSPEEVLQLFKEHEH